MKLSKKGVSPLISTVLLIAFAVALGAIVMNWGSVYVKGQTTNTETSSDRDITCSMDVALEIIQIDNVYKICYNNASDQVEFIIQNKGRKKIESILVNLVGNISVPNSQMINQTLEVGYVAKMNVSYDDAVHGVLKKAMYIPKVSVGGVTVTCSKNAYTKEEIDNC